MKKLALFFGLSLCFVTTLNSLNAQRNFTLYQFQNTHQALNLNPAFRPDIKKYISFGGGLVSLGLNHTGFVIDDLLVPRAIDDSLDLNIANAIDKMEDVNQLSFDLQNELFSFGYRIRKTHLMFSVAAKNQWQFFYPKDLFRFAFEGNGGSLLGQRVDLDGLGFKLNSYTEYALGFNRSFLNDRFSFGARVKVLSGIYNAHTSRSRLGIHTNDTTFDVTIDGALTVKSSYLGPIIDLNFLKGISNAFTFKNIGLGWDFGAQWAIGKRLELSASVIDLGFIKWNSNNRTFISDDVNFVFQGINLNQYLSDSVNYFNNFRDSLAGMFDATQNTDSYVTSLNTRIFFGARMKIIPTIYANALFFNEFVLGNYSPGFSLGATFQAGEIVTISTNYMVYGRFAENVGVGLNFRRNKGFQCFLMTDNIIGVFKPKATKNWHVNFGVSASIGRPDRDAKKHEDDKK